MAKFDFNFDIVDRKGNVIKEGEESLKAGELLAAVLENPTEDIMKDPIKLLKRNKLVKALYDGKAINIEDEEVDSIKGAVAGSYLKLFISAQIIEKLTK